ncbi:hypothetical protein [Streptomyces bacillaris]|uniref:hypothetical protein n=1 Tax=Streptomyces bacillaris TaxID=68179 RepID=UPI0036FFD9F6
MHGLLSWRDLTEQQRAYFLAQCTALPTFNDHTVQKFFAHLADCDADAAVRLLRMRVECWEKESKEGFTPLPFQWSVLLPFAECPERLELLRALRDWLTEPRDRPYIRDLLAPDLFWVVAGNADEPVRRLLLEPYAAGNSMLVESAAPLLFKLPKSIVWDRADDLIAAMLKSASRISEKALHRTQSQLHSAAINGVRWGTPGEPYAEDLDIRRRAGKVRDGLPRGPITDRFYGALEESAQRSIDRETAEDFNAS